MSSGDAASMSKQGDSAGKLGFAFAVIAYMFRPYLGLTDQVSSEQTDCAVGLNFPQRDFWGASFHRDWLDAALEDNFRVRRHSARRPD